MLDALAQEHWLESKKNFFSSKLINTSIDLLAMRSFLLASNMTQVLREFVEGIEYKEEEKSGQEGKAGAGELDTKKVFSQINLLRC